MGKHVLYMAVLFFMILSCATTNISPIGEQESFKLQQDERRIWNRSIEEQSRLNNSNLIYEGIALTDYVNEVAEKLIPDTFKDNQVRIKVIIIKNPLLNAFAYPNGVIYVHTGILAKMENEAQLATLLAHEMTHVTHRHSVQQFRNIKNSTTLLATVQMATIPFGVYGDLATLLGSVGVMASVTGYSREMEAEADEVGLDLMSGAGYDPQEAPKLFAHLKSDLEENDVKEPFFFGSHPRLQDRINSYESLLKSDYSQKTGINGDERFNRLISSLLLDNAMMHADRGRYKSAQGGVEKYLKMNPSSASGHFCLGEIYRQRGEAGDRAKAEKEYRSALACDPGYPFAHKGLGIIYYKQGMKKEAVRELEKYLQLLPEASDRAYIEQYIKKLKK